MLSFKSTPERTYFRWLGEVLKQHRPALDAPPPEAWGNPRWRKYVDYYEWRLGEVEQGKVSTSP